MFAGKVCILCGEAKQPGEFLKDASRRDGLRERCKSCRKLHRAENRDKILASERVARSKYRETHRRASARWRRANPEKCREYCRARRKRVGPNRGPNRKAWEAENRESIRAAAKRTYERHKERYLEKNRKHYLAHKADYRERDRRRRALELVAGGRHTAEQIAELLVEQDGACAVPTCRKPLKTEGRGKYHIDHNIPLSRGGSDGIENLSLLCPYCNRSKGAKTMDEYMNFPQRLHA